MTGIIHVLTKRSHATLTGLAYMSDLIGAVLLALMLAAGGVLGTPLNGWLVGEP